MILDFFFFFFFFTFPKKWVGRAMGNETFYGDGLIILALWLNEEIFELGHTIKSRRIFRHLELKNSCSDSGVNSQRISTKIEVRNL